MAKRRSISEIYTLIGELYEELSSHEITLWNKHRKLDESYDKLLMHEKGVALQDAQGLIGQAKIKIQDHYQIKRVRK